LHKPTGNCIICLQNQHATSSNPLHMLKVKRNLLLWRLVVVEKRGAHSNN